MPDARLVPAYSVRTGRKLADPVPEHYFDHPVIGKSVRRTPRSAAKSNTDTPASGENDKEK